MMGKPEHEKTALVLAGGGLTGAVYEIGALRAINDLMVDRTVNDFDIFVGTSAGALVSAFLANGMSPEDMLEVIAGTAADQQSLQRSHIFRLNRNEFLHWGLALPRRLRGVSLSSLKTLPETTFLDMLWAFSGLLPSGLYDSLAIDDFVSDKLSELGYANSFSALGCALHIIATDLDTGERVVFDRENSLEIPISLAVAASSAVPLLYKPVRIGDREFVDGGLRGTASLDLAVEQGATLIVCINPMVPFDHVTGDAGGRQAGPRAASRGPQNRNGGHPTRSNVSHRGIQSIANQTLRIFTHAGLHYHIKQLRRSHPEVDIILIEPRSGDYQMSSGNIMRYSDRLVVARHGFESVTLDLAVEYGAYKQILARHGVPITRRLVIKELAEIAASGYDPAVIRRVLEARTTGCEDRRKDSPLCRLDRVLAELDLALDQMD